MLQIKKTTTALIDIDVERARVVQALPSITQSEPRAQLLGILTYVERFDIRGAAGLYEQLPIEYKKLINPYIAEMLADYNVTNRLRGTPYTITAPKYDVSPAQPELKNRYNS